MYNRNMICIESKYNLLKELYFYYLQDFYKEKEIKIDLCRDFIFWYYNIIIMDK